MHVFLTQKNSTSGFSTIEILITFSIGIMFLTAAMMVAFSDPTLTRQVSMSSGEAAALDTVLDTDALATSSNSLGAIVAKLSKNWTASITGGSDSTYTTTPVVTDISPCFKTIGHTTTWNTTGRTGRTMTFGTGIANIGIDKALGNDCDPFPIADSWTKPRVYSRHNFNPGKPISLDVLNRVAYITDDKGKLQIYDASNDTLGNTANFSITPYSDAGGKQLNAVDVAKIGSKRYAFVTRHDKTAQFQVIDVTTPGSYATSAAKTLGGTTPPSGSFPEGWRVFYYDKKAYVTTRETAGFEFHIFDVSSPLSPTEVGTGMEINGTVNDFLVTNVTINNTTYKLAFLATDRSANEVMVLNVTNPSSLSLITSIDIPTNNDVLSIELLGNKLYVGRKNTTGSGNTELLVYTITYGQNGSNPTVTFNTAGTGGELGSDATYMRVTSPFVFIGNPLATVEFSVWNISRPTSAITRVDTSPLNVSNKVFGIEYESPYLYVISQANDSLQIIYSAP